MLFQTVEKFLSSARLHPYKVATNGNEALTLALYADNLRIAQSFYTCLSVFEVAFRNSMHDSLMTEFHSSNWLLEQKSGFMTDKRLIYISKEGKEAKNEKVLNMVKAALKGRWSKAW